MEILTNKSYKTHSKYSRYQNFPIYYHTIDGKFVQGTDAWLNDSTTYTSHIVKQNDSYDSLALYYYNNPTLYWIICSFNHVVDPFKNPEIGTTLKIPSISNIDFDIGE